MARKENHGVHYGSQPREIYSSFVGITRTTITHVVGKDVQPAIIRICFLLQVVPDVMLRNEMTRQRV
jgi:hypothetical protein